MHASSTDDDPTARGGRREPRAGLLLGLAALLPGLAALHLGLAAALAIGLPAPVAAQAVAPSVEEAEREQPSSPGPEATRRERLAEAAALEAAASAADDEDRAALRRSAIEERLAASRALLESVERAGEASPGDQEGAASPLADELVSARRSLDGDYETVTRELVALEAELAGATDPVEKALLEGRVRRHEEIRGELLETSTDLVLAMDALGLQEPADRARLVERVEALGRLASSRLRRANERRDDLRELADSEVDSAEIQAALVTEGFAARRAHDTLESVTALMARLDLDATAHRRLLVESTGELTVEAIDREVAGELLQGWISGLREGVVANGPRIAFQVVLTIVILGLFLGLSRFVRRVVRRAVAAPHLRFSELLRRMIVTLSSGLVLLIGVLIALSQLGIEIGPMLAGLGIAGFVLGFALQDTLGNFAAGIMILMYRPYDVGDMIDCAGGVFGKVSNMSLVSTTILTIDNKTLIVPNSKIWGDVITNVTAQSIRRVDLEFGIGYGDDIEQAEEVLWSVVRDHPKVLADPEPIVKVVRLGESSVDFIVRPWVERADYWDVYWDFHREVKLRFDREGITIPFPQRDVHVRSVPPATTEPSVSESESESAGEPEA